MIRTALAALAAVVVLAAMVHAAEPIDAAKGEAYQEGDLVVTVTFYNPRPRDGTLGPTVELTFANKGDRRLDLDRWDRRLGDASLAGPDGSTYPVTTNRYSSRYWASGTSVVRHYDEPNGSLVLYPDRTLRAVVYFKRGLKGAATLDLPGPDKESVVRFQLPDKIEGK